MDQACPFCSVDNSEHVLKNEVGFVRYDLFPVSPGHALVIPFRHVPSYFDISDNERQSLWDLVNEAKVLVDREFKPDAYNIGVNVGDVAGQSVPHLHIHLIPRYQGDMQNPRGGVRGVIPEKQKY